MAPSPTDRNIVYLTLGRKLGQEGDAAAAADGDKVRRYIHTCFRLAYPGPCDASAVFSIAWSRLLMATARSM